MGTTVPVVIFFQSPPYFNRGHGPLLQSLLLDRRQAPPRHYLRKDVGYSPWSSAPSALSTQTRATAGLADERPPIYRHMVPSVMAYQSPRPLWEIGINLPFLRSSTPNLRTLDRDTRSPFRKLWYHHWFLPKVTMTPSIASS